MEEKTLFPREEKSEILFKKISEDKWACEKLMETFCSYLFSNDGVDLPDSPLFLILIAIGIYLRF